MSIADLTEKKNEYALTGACTLGAECFDYIIAILTAQETALDTLSDNYDALEARVEALEA